MTIIDVLSPTAMNLVLVACCIYIWKAWRSETGKFQAPPPVTTREFGLVFGLFMANQAGLTFALAGMFYLWGDTLPHRFEHFFLLDSFVEIDPRVVAIQAEVDHRYGAVREKLPDWHRP